MRISEKNNLLSVLKTIYKYNTSNWIMHSLIQRNKKTTQNGIGMNTEKSSYIHEQIVI
uniref:Uncharacterized protein n=1 Tax=Arion vulgaris TaxID=1028688 RepID=A0A0B7A8B3_9EUPU